MTVAVDDVVRATMEMNYPGVGAIQNVYYLQNQGVGVSDTQAIADVIEVLEALALLLSTLIALLQVVDGVRIINITPVPPTDVGYGVFADTTPFVSTGQVQPTQVALGANFHTARLSVSGRKYWGATTVGYFLNGGGITVAGLDKIALAAAAMVVPVVATNSTWRYGVVATSDKAFLSFDSYSLPVMCIIQRRRRATVGI